MMPVVAFVVLLLIGVSLCIGGAFLFFALDTVDSWIPWVWLIAGAWIISLAMSSPFAVTTGGAA